VEVTETLFIIVPTLVPVTFKEIVQEAPAASVPPDKLTADPPAAPLAVPPQPLLVRFAKAAIANPAGKLSVNEMPDNDAAEFGLLMLKFKLVTPFSGMLPAPNVFRICGGTEDGASTSTVIVLVLFERFGSLSLAVTVAVLFKMPAEEGVVTVSVALAAAPLASEPIEQVTIPPASAQAPWLAVVLSKLIPLGRVSVSVTPVAPDGPLLVTVSVYVSVLSTCTGLGEAEPVIPRSAEAALAATSNTVPHPAAVVPLPQAVVGTPPPVVVP
jgi:hypothetical protein